MCTVCCSITKLWIMNTEHLWGYDGVINTGVVLFVSNQQVLLMVLLTYLLTHSLTHSLIHSLIYLLTYLITYLLTHLLTYLLTPCSTILLEKLTGIQLVKKFPTFYETQRFITSFTTACHLSLSWARLIQSILPYRTSWRSILILSTHLPLDLPSGLFRSVFPTKALYTPLLFPMPATCPAHLILDLITRTILGEQYRSLSSSSCSFLHSPVTSSLLAPRFHLNTPFLLNGH